MTKYVLGIDAAWTEQEPSGIALATVNDIGDIKIVKIARSYDEFYANKIEWDTKVKGSKPELSKIISYCRRKQLDKSLHSNLTFKIKRLKKEYKMLY